MPLTKANYKLPKHRKNKISDKLKKQRKRLEFENANLALKGAKGSFVVFREKGLEDVFVADEL
jgi:ABC-type sulfate transport system substrate-binding protein